MFCHEHLIDVLCVMVGIRRCLKGPDLIIHCMTSSWCCRCSKSSGKFKAGYKNSTVNTELAADIVGTTVSASAVVRSVLVSSMMPFTVYLVRQFHLH